LLAGQERALELREDPKTGVSLIGSTEVKISHFEEVTNLLKTGIKHRTKEATMMN
jgi:hypothetical protein